MSEASKKRRANACVLQDDDGNCAGGWCSSYSTLPSALSVHAHTYTILMSAKLWAKENPPQPTPASAFSILLEGGRPEPQFLFVQYFNKVPSDRVAQLLIEAIRNINARCFLKDTVPLGENFETYE